MSFNMFGGLHRRRLDDRTPLQIAAREVQDQVAVMLDVPDDLSSITCSKCEGRGDGCVECVATGLELTDAQWTVEHAAWVERNL